jgi:signal peptidase
MSWLAPPLPRTVRVAKVASNALCALALGLLAVLLVGRLAGYRPLIEYSASMRPALNAGDVLVSQAVPAQSVRTGEIVSFSDPALGGRLVTHRVRAVHTADQRVYFLTRGDANAVPERWSVPQGAPVAKVDLRVPDLGWATAWLNSGLARIATLLLLALAVGAALAHRARAA